MADISQEKLAAQEEAMQRTEWERQRINYYRSLRYDYTVSDVDLWLDSLFDQQRRVFKAIKNPSGNQVRKEAGIGFFENAFAFVSDEKKKEIDSKKAAVRKKLQAEVDEANEKEFKRCNAYNKNLKERLDHKLNALNQGSVDVVEDYFTFALNRDSFSLDGNEYNVAFNMIYIIEEKQLVVDYRLPTMYEVSRIKEWKADKYNDIVSKDMNKTDYLEMYERILFDIALRVVGVLFESDSNGVLRSIVFNGSCIYNDWQELPTIIMSFELCKGQYSYNRVKKMDFSSKEFVSKLKKVNYLDDITAQKPPVDLWETPPSKLVVPIKSSLG